MSSRLQYGHKRFNEFVWIIATHGHAHKLATVTNTLLRELLATAKAIFNHASGSEDLILKAPKKQQGFPRVMDRPPGRAESGRVGSGRVGSGRVGSGRVGLGGVLSVTDRNNRFS